tara:strand:- start:3805 stop:4041 length:237 start_codon:yes stop_codon:yes gene_type:complete
MSIDKNDPKMKALMDMQKDLDLDFNKARFRAIGKKHAKKNENPIQDDYIGYLLDELQPTGACNDLNEWSDQNSDDFLD